jgi:HPt (histidine-containing phosphotransfer) domain-containing protein
MGADFVSELVATYLQDSRELIVAMRHALDERDVDPFRRAAHSLKSNAASFGAMTLSRLAADLETAARSGSLEGTRPELERLAAEGQRVEQALRAVEA